jgi:phage terminase large subunit-like protein
MKGLEMHWFVFDLVKVNSGYYLFDIEYEDALKEGGKIKVFQSWDEAEQYLVDEDIRGTIRDIVEER